MKHMNRLLAGMLAFGLATSAWAQEAAPAEAAPAEAAPAEAAPAEAPTETPAPEAPPVPTEADHLAVLQDANAGWEAKVEAARALAQVGTVASVPALAALLGDEKLSHYARYALEVIPGPEATQALIDALSTVPDAHKVGIASTLGVRRDEAAVAALGKAIRAENDEVAASAAAALGRIGTVDSMRALYTYAKQVPDVRRVAVGEALLAAGQALGNSGNAHRVRGMVDDLQQEAWPEHIRIGAFEVAARSNPSNAHIYLSKALAGEDAKMRDTAAALVAELHDSPTKNYLRALPKLSPAGQAALLKALGMRGDAEAEPALIAALDSETPEVRAAAMQALGDLDTPGAIPVLAKLLTPAGTPECAAAHEALRVSRARGADTQLAKEFRKAEGEQRIQLLELLTDRLAPDAVVIAKATLEKEQDPALRLAAWRALAQLGGEGEVAVVLQHLPENAEGDESAAAAKALAAVAAHHPDAALPQLVQAMANASPQRMPVLLRTLPRVGTPAALEQALAALSHADAAIQDEAVQVLEDWPTADALPHLLNLAQAEDAARHERGLRGYVRIARTEQDPNKRAELLDAVMPLARKKEEKWAVLAAYGTVMHPRAFDALQAQLGDAEVKNEAGAAIITVASELGKNADLKPRAIEALDAVLASCDQQGVQDRAKQAREKLAAG